ncbi:DNA/RNA non-specific endonuclease [Fictibacillus sp. WQ 8-8]|uniref:DNA/RNA non-specific endonuclease n=1 Tax=Fictibacillus sp. WQ 8-8 TaxID=2938788 RepID=UPI00210D599B|nr:DNA/RNA non-specific endonuclease [Fictibacillus sp. WQ 8-8]MCQ6264710.1 DNA/RNA non-specific endonuclease [Fictibacillus sp. WQ 8-8]
MEIKIEPNRLANLSKRMLEHQNRAKNLQYSLERETGKISSILGQSEFPPPFSGQLSATNDSIKETSKTVVRTLEYQAAWLSYFAHKASGADNVPLSLTQATAILAKYDDRFKDSGKTDGIDAGKLAKDAAGELTGVYDAQRALTGIDPATGERVSGWGRVLASGMFVFGLTPLGKGVKAFKLVRTADKVIGVAKEGQAARRVIRSTDVVKGADNIIRDGSHIGKNGILKPNLRYQTGEYDYHYKTDQLGRLNDFKAEDLKLTERNSRLPHKTNTPGKKPGDHAGHLAADRFGGSSDLDNLVSQSSSVNLSKYKKLENQWAAAIKEGKKVSVNVKVNYDEAGLRPASFEIKYVIDGVMKKRVLKN